MPISLAVAESVPAPLADVVRCSESVAVVASVPAPENAVEATRRATVVAVATAENAVVDGIFSVAVVASAPLAV